ncbi:MAG: ATP-binding protein [Fusobacteriaceae bacterium]
MKLKKRIILSVLTIIFIPLTLSYGIFFYDTIKNRNENLEKNLLEIAQLVVKNKNINFFLENKKLDISIEQQTDEYIQIFKDADIIVISDLEGTKYSHLDKNQVGTPFVNPVSWENLFKKEGYYSQMKGSMGITFRRFEPILSLKTGEIIGFVMVGKYYEDIFKMKKETILMFTLLFLSVSGIALILSINFANKMKKTLYGLEPEDIGRLYRDEKKITETLTDGMRAHIHEFKNRLHVILGLINLEKLDMAKKYILDIQELSEYDFKKFNNINNSFIKALLLGKNAVAEERKIELEVDRDSHMVEDKKTESIQDLATILGNLIENAFDSFKKSDRIMKKVKVKLIERENYIELEVWDNGEEISKADIKKIYTYGFSTKGEERGVGLFIVKEKLYKHKGEISLESNKKGKTFKVKMEKKNENSFNS